jgi:hypothetical protein
MRKLLLIPLSIILLGLTPIKTTDVKDIQSVSNSNFQEIDSRQKVYNDNITYGYYHDRGDPTADDFNQTTLTFDSTWHDLDVSSIVPENAKAVLLVVLIKDNLVGTQFQVRKNGNTSGYNRSQIYTQVANNYMISDFIIACDNNRIIEYSGISGTDELTLTIKGWLK